MSKIEKATFAAGCFWCAEAVFQRLKGVEKVMSGYSGGKMEDPTYQKVSTGETGHVEAIQVEFDPEVISYQDLLDVFWSIHDPTEEGKQGPDVGPQYQAAVFYHNKTQEKQAKESKKKLQEEGKYEKEIATKILPFKNFYPAEENHQDYYNKNSHAGYCRVVIDPKLDKLKKSHGEKLKTS